MKIYAYKCNNCGYIKKQIFNKCPICDNNNIEIIPDYYKTLKINTTASLNEIQKSFRILAKKYHPDNSKKTSTRQTFIDIANSYQILSNNEKRTVYNKLINKVDIGFKLNTKILDELKKWNNEANQTSYKWSKENFQHLNNLFMKFDQFINNTKLKTSKLLKGQYWEKQEIIKISKIAGLGYALIGFWLLGIGSIVFYYTFHYLTRRSPKKNEFYLGLLKILQILTILVWLIIIDSLPLIIHILFFINQLILFIVIYHKWVKHFKKLSDNISG